MASETLTKEGLAKRLRDAHGGLSLDEATGVVDAILDLIQIGLQEDGKVKIRGFGTFEVRVRKSRKSRHPATGEVIDVPESSTVAFHHGKGFFPS